MFGFMKPPPHIARLPKDQIDPYYKRLRWQIFAGIFIGYAGFYLLRKNFSLAMPFLIEQGYSKGDLSWALSATALAYGLSKFFMGNVSDRSNARLFLMLGLVLSAAISLVMGLVPWVLSSIMMIVALSFLNGWVQGMGWPPCGRVMVHWWSHKERGSVVSVWNVAHNVGGGLMAILAYYGLLRFGGDWHAVFYVPAMAAILVGLFAFITMRDTPQSVGLPPIEDYKNDYPPDYNAKKDEQEFSAKEIFFQYVFNNKLLWYIALANVFVYLIRYGILDWSPTYLKEAKQFTMDKSSWGYALYEWAGIPGTLLCGWVSDKFFGGRRGLTGVVFMVLTTIAVAVYWLNPAGHAGVDMAMLIAIGFLIYGPVMLIGLHALELVPKKAAGTAAGFTGMFGYIGGTAIGSPIIGYLTDHFGWDSAFIFMIAGSLLAIFFLILTLASEKRVDKTVAA